MMEKDYKDLCKIYKLIVAEADTFEPIKNIENRISSAYCKGRELSICLSNQFPKKGYVIEAKQLIVLMAILKKHSKVKASVKMMNDSIDDLIPLISKHEAVRLKDARQKSEFTDQIDLITLFKDIKGRKVLINKLAHKAFLERINGTQVSLGTNNTDVYITKKGKRFHLKDCPFCRGKELYKCSKNISDLMGKTACKCFSLSLSQIEDTYDHVTVFIDESVHKTPIEGNDVGNYSYIICKGFLPNELFIEDDIILGKGVDMIQNPCDIIKPTHNAILKVLITLLIEYNFEDNITIYSDNQAAVISWLNDPYAQKLAYYFKSVTVYHIPRKQNKKADALLRKNVVVKMSASEYRRYLDFKDANLETVAYISAV